MRSAVVIILFVCYVSLSESFRLATEKGVKMYGNGDESPFGEESPFEYEYGMTYNDDYAKGWFFRCKIC